MEDQNIEFKFTCDEKVELKENIHKDEDITQLINELSSITLRELEKNTDNSLANVCKLLESIYIDNEDSDNNNDSRKKEFRHSYSNIFNTMVRLTPENASIFGNKNNVLENLNTNIQWLKELTEETNIRKTKCYRYNKDNSELITRLEELQQSDLFQRKFFKLYDHISLEYARIAFSNKRVGDSQNKINELKSNLKKTEQKYSKIMNKAKSIQKEYVAILAIFAAVVVTFFSGIGFSSSILANINTASIYRFLETTIVLGLVLFNTLAILMTFMSKIMNLDTSFSTLSKVGNVTFIILIIAVFVCWKYQWLGCGEL